MPSKFKLRYLNICVPFIICCCFFLCPRFIFLLGVCFCKVLNVLGYYSYASLNGIAFKKLMYECDYKLLKERQVVIYCSDKTMCLW